MPDAHLRLARLMRSAVFLLVLTACGAPQRVAPPPVHRVSPRVVRPPAARPTPRPAANTGRVRRQGATSKPKPRPRPRVRPGKIPMRRKLVQAEKAARGAGANVLRTARKMMESGDLVIGSCWD
jgi:hypothetical protein